MFWRAVYVRERFIEKVWLQEEDERSGWAGAEFPTDQQSQPRNNHYMRHIFSLNFFCILCKILGNPLFCNWGTPAPPSPTPWVFPFTPSIGRNNICLSLLAINGEKHWRNKIRKFIFTTQFMVITYLKIKNWLKSSQWAILWNCSHMPQYHGYIYAAVKRREWYIYTK